MQLAVTPAMLNISMLPEETRGVLEQYLQAVYACRPDVYRKFFNQIRVIAGCRKWYPAITLFVSLCSNRGNYDLV